MKACVLALVFALFHTASVYAQIRVYDAANYSLVDELDLSIPPGPKNNRTPPPYDALTYSSVPDTIFTVSSPDTDPSHVYQKNYIGGTTEADVSATPTTVSSTPAAGTTGAQYSRRRTRPTSI